MIRILVGDALATLKTLPAESVHCVVTSPPYWGLRDYGVAGQLGLEATPEEHVERMVEVFREVRRVLRGDGVAWVNYGDCYATGAGKVGDCPGGGAQGERWKTYGPSRPQVPDSKNPAAGVPTFQPNRMPQAGLKPKDLVGMPWRVAFALQADGWRLRAEVVWSKPNCMPESCKDRPTKAHEQVFLLAKRGKYFYDHVAVMEPASDTGRINGRDGRTEEAEARPPGSNPRTLARVDYSERGRNLRSVWTIPTSPFPEAHFATFPPALVEPCIKAGTSEKGCCATCGAPWERMVVASGGTIGRDWNPTHKDDALIHRKDKETTNGTYRVTTTGWRPTCDHGGDPVPATVLDPFGGSGTVGLVADRLGRDAILVELNPKYAAMAERRIRNDSPMFAKVERR